MLSLYQYIPNVQLNAIDLRSIIKLIKRKQQKNMGNIFLNITGLL